MSSARLDNEEEEGEVMSGQSEPSKYRDPRFLLYWMTTTATSTTTTFTATTSIGKKNNYLINMMFNLCVGALSCTPTGFSISVCG